MTTTKSSKKRIRSVAKYTAVPLGLLASGALVLGFSNAAFTAQTSNTGNDWATGSVSLSNNLTVPLFSHTGTNVAGGPDGALAPGDLLANRPIQITYTGGNAADIRLFANLGTQSGGNVANYINLTINDGTSNIYQGTLANLAASNTSWATGIGGWTPGGTETRTFTFHASLDANAPAAAAGQTVTGTSFTWEARAA